MSLSIASYSSSFPLTNPQFTKLECNKLILPSKLSFHKALGSRETRCKYSHWNPIHWNNVGIRIGERRQEHREGKVEVLGRVYNEGKSKLKNPIAVDLDEYAHLLKECTELKSLERGRKVHQLILDSGIDITVYLGNLLISRNNGAYF
ncbi:hypothetical protein SUGI_0108080 [Cryptomeria japonica]|nr:hypothetical protein SUGI_0108080 [Cryptomeria japonica]